MNRTTHKTQDVNGNIDQYIKKDDNVSTGWDMNKDDNVYIEQNRFRGYKQYTYRKGV